MRYVFAGGGTGGHIFPAIAIADEVRKADPEAEILFVGAMGRIEEKIVPSNNYRLETIEIAGIDRSSLIKNLKLPLVFLKALGRCREILEEFMPDAAVGTGGFVCGPLIYQAQRMGIPTLIQEGNAFAGKTVKFLSSRSDKVVINFDETRKYLRRQDNIVRIGHPVRTSLKRKPREEALKEFGLGTANKTVLIFGGSQGARGINNAVTGIAEELTGENVNLIWQCGRNNLEEIQKKVKANENIRVMEFIENMDAAYSASDLAVCRAGITSIMELALMKVPSILIPLPGSAENHQEINARTYSSRGCAEVVLQNDAAGSLGAGIMSLLADDLKRKSMSEAAVKFADPGAAGKIAEEVISLAVK